MNRNHRYSLARVVLLLTASMMATISLASEASAAPTRSVTGQATFGCQAGSPDPGPVSVQYVLTVPTSVQPGQRVSIDGTVSAQLPENIRQLANSLGVTSFEILSANLSLVVTAGGRRIVLTAPRWESGPTPVGNPLIASGPISFPAFTVPAGATGPVKLQLPQNGSVPTNQAAGTKPARVAFTVQLKYHGGALNGRTDNSACFSTSSNPPVFASIPVARAGQATPPPSASGSGSAAPGQPVSTPRQPTAPGAPSSNGSLASTGTPSQDAVATDVVSAATGPGVIPQAYLPPREASGGVYVPTAALVLGGFVICLGSLGYAAFASYRLRSIRRSLQG